MAMKFATKAIKICPGCGGTLELQHTEDHLGLSGIKGVQDV
jgi:hypothetical protein